jgi:UDP-GlcNAc:undecaprenyl-phosphate/decaprenyl-phosphate GlcNAc-1-phosphate transferase
MEELGGWEYAAVFAATLCLTLLLTPLALRFALRRGVLDKPGGIKTQSAAVPYLGGAAILLAFVVALLVAALIAPPNDGLEELAVILGLAVLLGVVGLADDLRGLSPWWRLAVEVSAGVIVWATPAGAEVFGNDLLDLFATVGWIVVLTNALNLLDNMDGLSAGVSFIAAFFLFVLAADNGQFLVATLSIALAGCAAGFLRSNFHPARIYMGDAGALFLGFMLAVLSLKLTLAKTPQVVAVGVPVVVMGIPLFDTTLVVMNRLMHRLNPMSGGRDHTSHRLVFIGIPVPVAVTLIYAAGASLGCLALVLSKLDRGTGLILLGWLAAVGALLGLLLSSVPVYANSRRRHLMIQEVRQHNVEPTTNDGTQLAP